MQKNLETTFLQKSFSIFAGALAHTFPKKPFPFVDPESVYILDVPIKKKNSTYLELYVSPLAIKDTNVNAKEYKILRSIFGQAISDVFYEYRSVFAEEVLELAKNYAPEYVDCCVKNCITRDELVREINNERMSTYILYIAENEIAERYIENGCGRFRIRLGLMNKGEKGWFVGVINTDAPDFRCIEDIVEKYSYEKLQDKLSVAQVPFSKYAASIETNFYTSNEFTVGSSEERDRILRDFIETIENKWKLTIPYTIIAERFPY